MQTGGADPFAQPAPSPVQCHSCCSAVMGSSPPLVSTQPGSTALTRVRPDREAACRDGSERLLGGSA